MADRRPLVTPGRIDEIDDADRAIVSGIVRTAAGDLTFEDSVTGSRTLAQLAAGGGGSGDVVGPASATDEAVARFDLATGKLIKNSVVTISDAGAVAGVTTLTASGAISGSNLSGTNTGDQTITLTGDVTGSGTGSFAATIAAGAVSYAKIQDVSAASRLLGRGSAAGAGDVQELTLGSNLSISGTALSAVGLSGTNTGDQTITLTGDVTGSGTGSFAATIANDAVTFAKIQNVAADKLLGRGNGGGTGDTQEITLGTNLSMSGTTLNAASVPLLLHWVRRSAQLNNITSAVFPGYDTTQYSINSTYWSYSAGTWTCNRAHVSKITAAISGQYSGAVSSNPYMAITYSTGGAYNDLQNFETSIYSTTTQYFHLSTFATRSWAVGETMRVYMGCYTGDMDVFADKNICFIEYVSG